MHEHATNPPLIVALALAVGIVAQSLAQHLRIPGIVILLAAGVLLGPDVAGLIRPADLGAGLHMIVGFAIAVILFEGGLNLEYRRLRREARTIRLLVTAGALVTWFGGAVAARYAMGWGWTPSILFGSLVIVTGPTVITPLLRRIKVRRNVETILEAEGVFIDAIGAIIAVVALEVSLGGASVALGFASVPTRLITGLIVGAAGGVAMAFLLRFRGVVPEGLENVFTLSLALAVFQVSNALSPESGIVAVIAAGLVVGNTRNDVQNELKEFKEQLTVMLIGLLFVLLAADVRVSEVLGLGWAGVVVVLLLMFVVRPVGVLLCTLGGGLNWRERAFLSWLAPRGIVAAAVATLFYERLNAHGVAGGGDMRAMVFLVIAVTVVFQGLTGGIVARRLGVRRLSGNGYVILGAHPVALELAGLLRDHGEDVALIDANSEACREAQQAGFRVLQGNALEDRVLMSAGVDTRKGVVATLPNEAVNLLFARKARSEFKVPRAYVAIQRGHGAFSPAVVHEGGASVLFAEETDLELWDVRLRRGLATRSTWRRSVVEEPANGEKKKRPTAVPREMQNMLMPFAVQQEDGVVRPLDDRTTIEEGTILHWLTFDERDRDARKWLSDNGWEEYAVPSATETPENSDTPA